MVIAKLKIKWSNTMNKKLMMMCVLNLFNATITYSFDSSGQKKTSSFQNADTCPELMPTAQYKNGEKITLLYKEGTNEYAIDDTIRSALTEADINTLKYMKDCRTDFPVFIWGVKGQFCKNNSACDHPLITAIKENQYALVEWLVESAGVSANAKHPRNKLDDENERKAEEIPLHLAINLNKNEMAKLLIKNSFCVKDVSEDGEIFHFVLTTSNKELLKIFNTIEIISKRVQNDYTIVYFMVKPEFAEKYNQLIEVCRNLFSFDIKEKNIVLNEKDVEGNTPLHLAILSDNDEIAKLLIENGADVYEKNVNDKTPLDLAKNSNNLKIVELLTDRERSQVASWVSASEEPIDAESRILIESGNSSEDKGVKKDDFDEVSLEEDTSRIPENELENERSQVASSVSVSEKPNDAETHLIEGDYGLENRSLKKDDSDSKVDLEQKNTLMISKGKLKQEQIGIFARGLRWVSDKKILDTAYRSLPYVGAAAIGAYAFYNYQGAIANFIKNDIPAFMRDPRDCWEHRLNPRLWVPAPTQDLFLRASRPIAYFTRNALCGIHSRLHQVCRAA